MIINQGGQSKKKIESIPSQSGSLTYTGGSLSPAWDNYDPEQLTVTGTTSAVNAGTYTVAFTPTSRYKWADGTTAAKVVEWTIGKADGSLSLSASSGTIRLVSDTKTFTVTRAGDGAISVKSSNTAKATVTISGNTVTVKPTGTGTATITVSVAEGTNHKAPSNKTYSVTTQGYLIYNGVPCYTVVGVGKAHNNSGFPAASSVTTKQYDGYYYVATSDANCGMAYLNTKVDLTNYSKITINGTFTQDSDNQNLLSIWTSIGNYVHSGRSSVAVLGATSASLDVSSIERTVYVGLSLKDKAQKITGLRLT